MGCGPLTVSSPRPTSAWPTDVSHPVVSVNICTYNSSRYVGETLQSVFAQTLQDFEIIIVDDGSSDGTPDAIERDFPDPRITVVRQRHVTLRVARPLALAHSTGEYIAFLDSDDLWAPTKLERQVAVARAAPDGGLILSDCELIDSSGRAIGYFSDQFDYGAMDFAGTRGHTELLRCGNFIASPTPMAPAAAIRAVGGFNHTYRHVNDYELWLRLARRYSLKFIREPLARYRIHDAQFTQRRPEVTLPEQCALIRPIIRSSSYPPAVRIALGDNLLGQHRLAFRLLTKQRRYGWAARAALGMCHYPDRLRDYWRHKLSVTAVGPAVEWGVVAYHRSKHAIAVIADVVARGRARVVNEVRKGVARARRAPSLVSLVLHGVPIRRRSIADRSERVLTQFWIDGSSLGREQTGYFNLLTELIRQLARHHESPGAVHIRTTALGRAALLARLGPDGARLQFHHIGWRALHWSQIYELATVWQAQLGLALVSLLLVAIGYTVASQGATNAAFVLIGGQLAILSDHLSTALAEARGLRRERYSARLVRFLWRRLPRPHGLAPVPNTTEVLFWRGRFRWRNSHRVAVVQDMTTRSHPELHTEGNVREFDEFLGYVQRHAHSIATVSEQSRRNIVDRIAVHPESVSVIPMPIHPQYVDPRFSRGYVAARHHQLVRAVCWNGGATQEPQAPRSCIRVDRARGRRSGAHAGARWAARLGPWVHRVPVGNGHLPKSENARLCPARASSIALPLCVCRDLSESL